MRKQYKLKNKGWKNLDYTRDKNRALWFLYGAGFVLALWVKSIMI